VSYVAARPGYSAVLRHQETGRRWEDGAFKHCILGQRKGTRLRPPAPLNVFTAPAAGSLTGMERAGGRPTVGEHWSGPRKVISAH
jgi:hypothetical protein